MSDIVIRVENLSKEYRLGTISHGTLYQDLQSSWAKFRGREDPNSRICSLNSNQALGKNDRFCALSNVSFTVERGEIVGIIGRNGAGKSTLLKIISRVTAPTSGSIKIKGRVASLLEVGTGFHPELTGRENIFLNGAILGMNRKEIEQKFDEIVKFSEIEKFIDTPVKRYSSGMYVRLAFAVAAHLEPEILIIDEVLAVGDAAFQNKCLGKMGGIAKEGRTVLFVSHNMGAVQNLCNRVILINEGKILFDGNSQGAVENYLYGNMTRGGIKEWKNPYEQPGDDVVKIKSIRLLNDSDEAATIIPLNVAFKFDIYYHVAIPDHPLDIGIFIYNSEGICVLFSMDNRDSPWSDHGRPVGDYHSVCEIPGQLLNTGVYFVHVGIAENYSRRVLRAWAENVISFDIMEDMDENGVRGNFKFDWPASIIRPNLKWTVNHLDKN